MRLLSTSVSILLLSPLMALDTKAGGASPFDDLINNAPADSNVLVLLNPLRVYDSALSKRQDWKKQYWDRYRAGVTLLPPDAKLAVIASHINFNTLTRDFQVALVKVRQTEPIRDIQSREGGTISEIAGRFVLLSLRNAYITPLNVETLATVYPANRQSMARWLKDLSAKTRQSSTLSPVLLQAAKDWGERADVVLAVDLSDAIDPGAVRAGIDNALSLSGKSVNRDGLTKVLASARSLVFAATIGYDIRATIKVSFELDPRPFRDSLHSLFLELLDTQGLQIPGLSTWPAVFDESSMTLTGTVQTEDLQMLISLFQFPSHHEGEPPEARPTSGSDPGSGTISAEQTRRYVKAVDNILVKVKMPPPAQNLTEANRYTQAALAIEASAEQIDHLSRANVDPIAIEAAQESAKRLRAIASSLKGVPVDLNVINSGSYYYVSGGFPGWIGWGRRAFPFVAGRSVNTNIPQANERMMRVIADDQKNRDNLMGEIQSTMNEAKQKLAEKYGGTW